MTEYRNVTIDGDRIQGERTLGEGSWIRFQANRPLLRISLAIDISDEAFNRIWSMQDGYGEPGYGDYDWSGIRDSTPETVRNMDTVAREFVSDAELDTILGVR